MVNGHEASLNQVREFDNELFKIAMTFVDEHHPNIGDAQAELSDMITNFFKGRGSYKSLTLDSMMSLSDETIQLVGSVYHFGRKAVMTSYDVNPHEVLHPTEIQEKKPAPINPLPLIRNVLASARPLETRDAAQYLEDMCGLMNKDHKRQAVVLNILTDALPPMVLSYDMEEAKFDPRSGNEAKKYQLDRAKETHASHMKMLVGYIRETLGRFDETSIWRSDFEVPNGNEFLRRISQGQKSIQEMNLDYLMMVSEHPAASIRSIEDKYGGIVGFNYASAEGKPTAKITILTGNADNPAVHIIEVPKDVGRNVKQSLATIGSYVQHLSGSHMASARETAARAIEKVQKYIN